MNGKVLPWFALFVPDNNCKLVLIELFLDNHQHLNSQYLYFVQGLEVMVAGDTKISSQPLLLGRRVSGAES